MYVIVRVKEKPQIEPRWAQPKTSSGTNQPIKALRQRRQESEASIKEETIAINRDWVYNQTCRLSHDIHVISIFL